MYMFVAPNFVTMYLIAVDNFIMTNKVTACKHIPVDGSATTCVNLRWLIIVITKERLSGHNLYNLIGYVFCSATVEMGIGDIQLKSKTTANFAQSK